MATRAAHLEILVTADTDRAQRGLAGVEKETGRFSRVGAIAKRSMLGLGVALTAGGFAAYKMIGAASDLNETINKVQVVFGQNGDAIEKWGERAIDTLGMSEQSALDAASIFGVFGQSAGLTGDKLTGFSTKLVAAAADLSSFHNVPIEESLDALRSGLAGETEPLRRFGILLNDADLRQQALKLGLVDTTKNALTPQQRTLAAQALILKRLGPATGDYARTQGGLANTTRRLRERLANLTAHMGQVLLPVAAKAADALDRVLKVVQRIVDAPNAKVRISILISNVKRLASSVFDEIRDAFRTTTKRIEIPHRGVVFEDHKGLGLVLADQISAGVKAVDWGMVGSRIAAGIGAGVHFTSEMLAGLGSSFLKAVNDNREAIIVGVLQLALNFFSTLTDPAFWLRNWRLVLEIAVVVLLSRFKIVRTVIEKLPFGKAIQFALDRMASVASRLLRRLGTTIWRLIERIAPGAAKRAKDLAETFVLQLLFLPSRVGGIFARLGAAVLRQLGRMLGWAKDRAGRIGSAIADGIGSKLRGLAGSMGGLFKGAINALIRAANTGLNWIASHWPDAPGLPGPPGFLSGGIPYLARGTRSFGGGLAIVGEHGPELVNLPRGSRVNDARSTRGLLDGMGKSVTIENLNVNVSGAVAQHPGLLLDRIGHEIHRRGIPALLGTAG